jgi:AAA+ ATPase superfamily predicted ATPase
MPTQSHSFTGRKQELTQLAPFLKKSTASLLVIKGRRRVGKSRLAEEFAKGKTFYKFTGLAPVNGIDAQAQRDEFARQLSTQLDVPRLTTLDWAELFSFLGRLVQQHPVIILFDEISWMAQGDKTFLSKLKNAWEESFKTNPKLILILCSSISTWIEKNIVNSTGYFGRISWTLHLDPLPLKDCKQMLVSQGFKTSDYEIFKILSVTGGIPWYIEQMNAKQTADDNIQRQCFTKGAVLTEDFDLIFHELFIKRDDVYKKIVSALANGPVDYHAISEQTGYPKSGRLTEYIEELTQAGFIEKQQTWSLKTGNALALSQYRLSDNYLRFYLKYIAPKKAQIEQKRISSFSLAALSGWEGIMGLQFENLVVNNRHELYAALNIKPEDVVYDNPYFQRPTKRQAGVQIDFLIQTKHNTLYIIEIKFSKNKVANKVIDEVKRKIEKINLPSNKVCLPILVHVNGVSEPVAKAGYFYDIIAFNEMLA